MEIAKSGTREHGTRYDYPIYHKHTDICQKLVEKDILTAWNIGPKMIKKEGGVG